MRLLQRWYHRPMTTATSQAHPNIAFIKYWGNRDNVLRLPMNGSISMNLDGLTTRTTVSFQHSLAMDELIINGHEVTGAGLNRVAYILDIIRGLANITDRAEVMTENNFPAGAGIASSASAFAALALAGSKAAGLNLSEPELSRLAGLVRLRDRSPAASWSGRWAPPMKTHLLSRLHQPSIGS
jgi:diphosphomevalonate decarboxylase